MSDYCDCTARPSTPASGLAIEMFYKLPLAFCPFEETRALQSSGRRRSSNFKNSSHPSLNYLANFLPEGFLPRPTINLGRPGPCFHKEAGPIPYDHEH
jgi:hypothetical protein